MGKFMRKAKIPGEVAIMEVVHTSLGVCTRSRALAMQKLISSPTSSSFSSYTRADGGGGGGGGAAAKEGSFLQLRNRRLEKPPVSLAAEKERALDSRKVVGLRSWSKRRTKEREAAAAAAAVEAEVGSCDPEAKQEGAGAEVESRERHTREITPCSLILDPDLLRIPGSTDRNSNPNASTRIKKDAAHGNIPTTSEIEEFFADAERKQQIKFSEKYNFDLVNDCPLPGRYEWTRLDS